MTQYGSIRARVLTLQCPKSIPPAAASSFRGQYTFGYAETVPLPGTSEFVDPVWSPCGGLFLTFKLGTYKVLLAPRVPAFPPATQVWHVTPVVGATGQYTIRAAYQKAPAPQFLAYSKQCTKVEPFLAPGPSAGVGVRWTMGTASRLFGTVGRACAGGFQLARFGAGTNASCAVPATAARQRSLKLLRSAAALRGVVVSWEVEQFSPSPYPEVLQGDDTVCPTWEAQPMFRNVLECSNLGATLAAHKSTIVTGQTAAAYVFTRGTKGWVRRMLPPPPPVPGDDPYVLREAPYAVAVSANLAVVGVPFYYRKAGGVAKRPGQVLVYQLGNLGAFPVVPRPVGAGVAFGSSVQVSDAFLAAGDGKNIFIFRLPPTPGAPLNVAAMVPQATLAGGAFSLWGSTLAVPSGNHTLVYEYNGATKKWAQRAKINAAGPMALHDKTLVFSATGGGFNATRLTMSVYQRNAAGDWALAQEIKEEWPSGGDPTFYELTRFSGPALDAATLVIGGTATTVSRSEYDMTHGLFVYTKSGPGGQWTRAATVDSGEDDHNLGTGPKAVAGDVIACGAPGIGYVRSPPGRVYLYSRRRELAVATPYT